MKRVETITISDFMSGEFKNKKRLVNKKVIVELCATTIIIALVPLDFVSADAGNIDTGARIIYGKLLTVGKWVIIIKGGIDTVNNAVQGNMEAAKKSFLSYLVVYMVLQGLPWAMDEVDNIFKHI